MVDLKSSQIRAIEDAMAYPNGFGYVLDFSDRTMKEFFEDEFEIEIYAKENLFNGSSKRNCLTTFLRRTDQNTALKVLCALWERREGLLEVHPNSDSVQDARAKSKPFQKVIEQLQNEPSLLTSDGVEQFVRDRTLEELVADIQRSLDANKPEVAIDHLHTYCVKKITHLLATRGIKCDQDEPLNSRFGKYRKCLESEQNLHEFTSRAMKSFISLFESFNEIRNNRSLAHDNEILDPVEARFIFSSISAMLVMLRALESARYGK
ncbi:MAG: abortive infection family protein [Desulfamplus sp.]|nr:abortive infection family protein [Desulfamplus sp.]